jgi:hypothetical protein
MLSRRVYGRSQVYIGSGDNEMNRCGFLKTADAVAKDNHKQGVGAYE